MTATLIVGFGNLDRADDGVAYHVVNGVRRRLGQPLLQPGETGLEGLGNRPDSVFIQQLVPELMETAAGYDRLVFVDAHVQEIIDDLVFRPIDPEYVLSPFTHHLTPAAFLALIHALYGREPAGYLLSIRGTDFDFHQELSAGTRGQVDLAVLRVLELLGAEVEERP
jgi:hydrogenase maturation protease